MWFPSEAVGSKTLPFTSEQYLAPTPLQVISMCLKGYYGLHDIYPVKVKKVIFFDVAHPPALPWEMPLGWMPSSPDRAIAGMLSYPLPLTSPGKQKVSDTSVTHTQKTEEQKKTADKRRRYITATWSSLKIPMLCENSQLRREHVWYHLLP